MLDWFFARVYRYLKKAGARDLASQYRKRPNTFVGENVKFGEDARISSNDTKITIGANTWMFGIINSFPHNEDCELIIGSDCYIGDHSRIWVSKKITIGDRTLIAHNVNIFDTTTHPTDKKLRHEHEQIVKLRGMPMEKYDTIEEDPVVIGSDVWIGCNAVIMKGVHIGDGVIIGAGSVVTHDIPDNVVAVGNPARVVKEIKQEG